MTGDDLTIDISDAPIQKIADDRLGFRQLVLRLVTTVLHEKAATPFVLGIYGEWGSGKTSFLNILADELHSQRGVYSVRFSASNYSSRSNVWAALLESVLDVAPQSGTWYQEAWLRLRLWFDRIVWAALMREFVIRPMSVVVRLALVVFAVYTLVEGFPQDLRDYLLSEFGDKVVRNGELFTVFASIFGAILPPKTLLMNRGSGGEADFERFSREWSHRQHISFLDRLTVDFKKVIRRTTRNKPLLIIVDDLDRCEPKQAIQVLDAAKVLLDVEGCIFVFAMDRKRVEQMLRKAGVRGKDAHIYLEKIVQMSLDMPRINPKEIQAYVETLTDDREVHDLWDIFAARLPYNPRRVRRSVQKFIFVRDFCMTRDRGNDSLKPHLLAKLIVVENECSGLFQEIVLDPELLCHLEHRVLEPVLASGEQQSRVSKRAASLVKQYPICRAVLGARRDAVLFREVVVEDYIYMLGTKSASSGDS